MCACVCVCVLCDFDSSSLSFDFRFTFNKCFYISDDIHYSIYFSFHLNKKKSFFRVFAAVYPMWGPVYCRGLANFECSLIAAGGHIDECLTCNVCDRTFHCHRQLASHQQKKRHFG